MNLSHLLLAGLSAITLCGCASPNVSDAGDPVRQRHVAEVAQATSDGTLPGNEKQFIYPHWPELTAHAGKETNAGAQAPAH